MAIGPKTTFVHKTFTETEDGMGGFSHVWTKVRDITGTFLTISDRERMMYGKKAEDAEYKFIVDYMLGGTIATIDRLYLGAREFEIVSREDPMNQQRFAIFFLTENVDG